MMKEAYGLSRALVVGTPSPPLIGDCSVGALLITATVAGTAQVVLSGGSTVPIAFGVGSIILTDLAVISITSTTGTATFYQLA